MTSGDKTTQTRLMSSDFTQIEPTASAPFDLFALWMADAEQSELNDPNAMSVATVDGQGVPNVRTLLLKGFDEHGFVFYTNLQSNKGLELLANPYAALCFHWKSLRRQVRVRGPVEEVSDAEADSYYQSRSEGSRIGAWASQQSRPLDSRDDLECAVEEYRNRFAGTDIPRPPHWSGFRVKPTEIEFWHDRPYRLHDRVVFKRSDFESKSWDKQRLNP
ncbi:MAG: pyridoxamine 5'-phosphate oxidase [Hyphomicrobiales bacterium]